MPASILWHDYETWGVDPKRDFPVQFAALRTDLDLNIIAKPVNYFCQIPNDYLPHPQACLVTGITPQQSLRDGHIEAEFAAKVMTQLTQPETCSAGYNSIKFDEEVTRNMFYRNFFPVYEREYQNGNSRWDIIDLVRAAYALRPEGIEWPHYDDGKPCFKLEELSQANGLEHESAHDALSDVYATIALAKLIKEKQPKLYEYYWGLRQKHEVAKHIDIVKQTPFLHISGYISSLQGCCSWFMPIAQHSSNRNALIAIDLNKDITPLTDMTIDALNEPGVIDEFYQTKQVPVSQIATNKVPFVANAKTLSPENATRLGIDRERCLSNYDLLKQVPDLTQKCRLFAERSLQVSESPDIDAQLYTRAFPSPADSQWMKGVIECAPQALSGFYGKTDNPLLAKQLFRYIGRNYPSMMDEAELVKWQAHRRERFMYGSDNKYLSLETFQQQIQTLAVQHQQDVQKLRLLKQLEAYASQM
ncbi:exodeoxyribonuclease I [Glaciecola sp. XM2]|jgi:exodeoxyribonuclease-1|uniref:exodeoxyribonuclease I n=1 Tax=Glaciecola sp. XM2 TaxID=1914931 RepID=UPI001BDEE96F|nr:exodeoxyribonuclease I [Glaciecola sp. XM2]MBT1449720.1 exodeoxyribonuclease I [Glaciecola sp. XM2]